MTDTTHEAPERIWINKVHGQHPEDWDFTDGKHLTKRQLRDKMEYVHADLVQAAVAAALTEAAEVCAGIRQRIANGPMPEGARFDYEQAILAFITPDAQAALDRYVEKRVAAELASGSFYQEKDIDAFEARIAELEQACKHSEAMALDYATQLKELKGQNNE